MILDWRLCDERFRGHDIWIADSGFGVDIAVQSNGQSWGYWPVDVLLSPHPLADVDKFGEFGFYTPDTAKLAAQWAIDNLAPTSITPLTDADVDKIER